MGNLRAEYINMPYILENNGVIVDINDEFINLTGFKKEELINKYIFDAWKDLLRINVQPNSIINETEIILFTKSLDVIFGTVQKHGNDKNNEFLYVFSNNTYFHLEDKFQFLNRLIADNKTGIAIYTAPDLITLKTNDTFIQYLPNPLNSKELIYGKCIKECRADFIGSKMHKAMLNVIKTNKSYYRTEKMGFVRDYESRYWDIKIIPIDESGKLKYIILMLDDVTERVLSREHIQLKNKQLEAIFEYSDDLIEIFDKDEHLVMGTHLLGKIFNDVKTNNFDILQEYFTSTDCKQLTIKKILNGDVFNKKRLKVTVNGIIKYFEINGKPIYDENENIIYAFIVYRDITENTIKIKLIEEQNKELEKALVMKDEFLSLISHEFKTPLNVIYSAIQLIEHLYYNQMPDRVKGYIGNIKQNTFRQLRLVNNLLDITNINLGQVKLKIKNIDIVFLTKAITESVKLYVSQKNINLSFKSNIKYKTISIDDEKYERIILNLLSNAIKFTKEEGQITVMLNENKISNMIEISVKDTGIGIPKDKQKIIFDKFGQVDNNLSRQAEGTGIGLSIVKSLVSIMEGTIDLESEPGKGSTFIVKLPTKVTVEDDEFNACLDVDNRLVQSINVEFSDIYL